MVVAFLCVATACGASQETTAPAPRGPQEPSASPQPSPQAPPALQLPESLPPSEQATPQSLALFLTEADLEAATPREFRARVEPYVGNRVRWWLRSWGGEIRRSGAGYLTPSGRQPRSLDGATVGRVRLVNPALEPDADLSDVWQAHQPVVHCLASFSEAEGSRFIHRGMPEQPAPVPRGETWVTGTIWGATGGDHKDLWLLDCEIDPPTTAPYGWQQLAAELETPGSLERRPTPDEPISCPARRPRQEEHEWYSGCRLRNSARFDPDQGAWVVLRVDESEQGPDSFELAIQGRGYTRSVLAAQVSSRSIARLKRALRHFEDLTEPENLVRAVTQREISLNAYAPMVRLGGLLEGWLLHVRTSQDLNQPEYVAWLIEEGGTTMHELARMPAIPGACDGDGYYCLNTDDMCDDAGLRAEGRLCVTPFGIDSVSLAPDHSSLMIGGTRHVAGHSGYPSVPWTVEVPAALSAQLRTAQE